MKRRKGWVKCNECAHWPRTDPNWKFKSGACDQTGMRKFRWPNKERICPLFEKWTENIDNAP